MNADLKAELAAVEVGSTLTHCLRAEVVTSLWLAGTLARVGGRPVIEATFDSEAAAHRLARNVSRLHGHHLVVAQVGHRRYSARLVTDAEALARATYMCARDGGPMSEMPGSLITAKCDAASVWRAALLARGSVTATDRSTALEVTCPDAESSRFLADLGRRMGVAPSVRETRGSHRVTIRDGAKIERLLWIVGASQSVLDWGARRAGRRDSAASSRGATLAVANARRASRAGESLAPQITSALADLGGAVPAHLAATAQLRLAHPGASLDALGGMHEPPLSKAAVASRLRRLLELANDRPGEQLSPGLLSR